MTIESRATSPWPARLAILIAGLLAYANTFAVPFVFDDIGAVTQNPSLASFVSALRPPDGLSVTGRPLVNLSLALNHAISGRATWSYHALNLALHLACALALFGLVRRTLALPLWHGVRAPLTPRAAHDIAAAGTVLWALHPLDTSAVTYVMQRTELLVSLCVLATLYGFVRALPGTSPGAAPSRAWLAASLAACAAGMAAKEVMAVAPLLVFLFDRSFVAGSFAGAWRARRGYYALLAATWLVLAALLVGTDSRGLSAGFAAGMAWTDYAPTQLYAVTHYLRLALWPFPLVFDYGAPLVTDAARVVPSALVVAGLVAATLAALRRLPALGFCGAAFLLLLAPSSSVVPIATQTIAEHRVYLALAPVAVAAAIGIHRCLAQRAVPAVLVLAAALGVNTVARNRDYRSVLDLWRDTAVKAPANARAHYNLGLACIAAGRDVAAAAAFSAALDLEPGHGLAHGKLGALQLEAGAVAEALPHLIAAARLVPQSPAAHYDLASALVRSGRIADAATEYAAAVRLDPGRAAAHYNLGLALAQLGRHAEALAQFEAAARLEPGDGSARANAARLRDYLGR